MPRRRPALLLVLALASCARPAVLPSAVPPPGTPAPRLFPPGCEAIEEPRNTLRALKRSAERAKAERRPPVRPELMAAKLEGEATALHAAKPVDPELDQLVADLRARLAAIAAITRALSDAHAADQELAAGAAYDELLRLAQSTDALLATGDRRCSAPVPPAPQLEPSVIQTVVRAQFGQLKGCYEDGLRRNVNLRGRISVRFLIERDGHVGRVTLPEDQIDPLAWPEETPPAGSAPNLLDADVRRCVAAEVFRLVFPAPRSETVTVTYPIVFAPRW